MNKIDETVQKYARESLARTALSYLNHHCLPPEQILAAYETVPAPHRHGINYGALVITAALGVLGVLPALFEGRPPAAANVIVFFVIGFLVLGASMGERFFKSVTTANVLRQVARALPAAIPILIFRPFDLPAEVVAIGLFSLWGAWYYIVPAEAPRIKIPLALAVSCLFFLIAAFVVIVGGITKPTTVIPVVGLLAIDLVVLNALGTYLSRRVSHIQLHARVLHELTAIQQRELNELPATDTLTGLASCKQALDVLARHWRRYQKAPAERRELTLVMIDVDYLAQLNEHYGHVIGDLCLKRIANLLLSCAHRPDDCVARYYANRFLLILHDQSDRQALRVADTIRKGVESMNMLNPKAPTGWVVTVSIGVCACVPRPGYSYVNAIQDVNATLAHAKAAGRNRVCVPSGVALPSPRAVPANAHVKPRGADHSNPIVVHANPGKAYRYSRKPASVSAWVSPSDSGKPGNVATIISRLMQNKTDHKTRGPSTSPDALKQSVGRLQ